jgi:SpoVK/Ycf46/Vps4 family AAA+-type ATPase
LIPAGNIEDVGGMQGLKEWIGQRADCYSDEAKEFGIEPPKGAALVGVPGAGKSLVAKAIASVLNVPLVKIDFSRVFSKFVGDSEQRMHSALKMVEAMAPIVLFADEIDKGLGGAGGGGDSGTSSRVLGAFLTWLQECKAPVFTLVTANRVNGLPPELLRKGRFDQIFSVGMPTPEERQEVLAIHLRKRGRDIADFNPSEISTFLGKSEKLVSAEIEASVKDGLVLAFHEKAELEMRHILAAIEDTVPMSVANAEAISAMVEWARNNATPVSKRPTPASAKPTNIRKLRSTSRQTQE